jgi:hypothetical protein
MSNDFSMLEEYGCANCGRRGNLYELEEAIRSCGTGYGEWYCRNGTGCQSHRGTPVKRWMIRHKRMPSGSHLDEFDGSGKAYLFWSNENGWCSKDCADVWTVDMKSIVGLPLNGQWVSIVVIPTKGGE